MNLILGFVGLKKRSMRCVFSLSVEDQETNLISFGRHNDKIKAALMLTDDDKYLFQMILNI